MKSKRWSSLSFSLVFVGEIGNHIRLSLSLSLTKSAFWKTRSPYRTLRGTRRERGIIVSEKEEIDASDTLARESRRKKKMDWISSHCGTRTPQPQIAVASKTKTHIYPRTNLCARVLPSVRPRGACLQNSFFLCCFNIYVCVYILCKGSLFDKRVRMYLCVLYSSVHEDKGGKCVTIENPQPSTLNPKLKTLKSFQKLPLMTKSNSAEH